MAKSKSKGKKTGPERPVKLIPPTSKEARDEGPRLIPLGRMPEEPRVQRYLELADAALSKQPKKPARPKKQPGQGRRS